MARRPKYLDRAEEHRQMMVAGLWDFIGCISLQLRCFPDPDAILRELDSLLEISAQKDKLWADYLMLRIEHGPLKEELEEHY